MAKSKSSASSATRKKHEKKKNITNGEEEVEDNVGNNQKQQQQQTQQRGQKKLNNNKKQSRFEPRIKSYIPPPPPPKGLIDPVDLYLLSSSSSSSFSNNQQQQKQIQVNSDLIVILRKLSKRDESTLLKGLESFDSWVRDVLLFESRLTNGDGDAVDDDIDLEEEEWKLNQKVDELVQSMKVWAHHLPRLILHPSRRIRLQSITLNTLFLSSSSTTSSTFTSTVTNAKPPSSLLIQCRAELLLPQWIESKDYVGSLSAATFDSDRQVKLLAKKGWNSIVILPSPLFSSQLKGTEKGKEEEEAKEGINLIDSLSLILDFASSQILALPSSLPSLSPSPSTSTLPSFSPSTNLAEDFSILEDLSPKKTQSLLLLSYILTSIPSQLLTTSIPKTARKFLRSIELWDILDSEKRIDLSSSVRRAGYDLLGTIVDLKEVDILGEVSSTYEERDEEGEEEEDEAEEEDGVRIVAERVLNYCWKEEEGCWAGVITFLRRYPQAWILADEAFKSTVPESIATIQESSAPTTEPQSEPNSDSEEEEDDDVTSCPVYRSTSPSPSPSPLPSTSTPSSFQPSPVLSLFLNHLSTACSSHPSTYPTILLLLATIPSSILPPSSIEANEELFENFWKAWGSRGLAAGMLGGGVGRGTSAVEEFVGSLLECLIWRIGSLKKSFMSEVAGSGVAEEEEKKVEELIEDLIQSWISGKVWKTYLGLKEEGEETLLMKGFNTFRVARLIEGTLGKIAGRQEDWFEIAWSKIQLHSITLLSSLSSSDSLPVLSTALKVFHNSTSEKLVLATQKLSKELMRLSIVALEKSEDLERSCNFFTFVESLRVLVGSEDTDLIETLYSFALTNAATLLSSPTSSPAHTASLLQFLSSQISSVPLLSANQIWTSLFIHPLPSSVLLALIKVVEKADITMKEGEELESAGLDNLVMEMCLRVLEREDGAASSEVGEEELEIVKRLSVRPHPFVNSDTPALLISLATFRLQELTFTSPITSSASLNSTISLISYHTTLESNAQNLIIAEAGVIEIFEVAEGLLSDGNSKHEEARKAWVNLIRVGGEGLGKLTMDRIRRHLLDTASAASTVDIINAAASLLSDLPKGSSHSLATLLPTISTLDSLYTSLRLSPPSSALSILNPLIQLSSSTDKDDDDTPSSSVFSEHFDLKGLNSYSRAILSILEISARDHTWTRTNIWILPHILLLGNVARDESALKGATTGMFSRDIEGGLLERIVNATDGLVSYVLSFVANGLDNDWQATTIATLRSKVPAVENMKELDLVGVLDGLARRGRNSEDVYSRRAFSTILKATLRYTEASLQDADRWLAFAQGLTEGSELACAIIISIKSILFETPRFERYQNELASTLAGIPSSAASERGVRVLRVLLSTAPPLDAPIIFLPQQRTMFLIQRMQAWISSEDDLVDEINTMMAELFLHLAPIVQELSGSHWDLIFDIIESNLETADWNDQTSLPALYHSAKLLEVIKDLASANAELRVTAKGRIDTSLELVRDLFVSRPSTSDRNQPKANILECLARLVRDLPPKLLTMGASFDQLLRLLQDPSMAVQHSSYNLVSRIADKYVTDLVVEAELDGDTIGVIQLPEELVKLILIRLPGDISQNVDEYYKASTYLLAWLTVFSFFDKASPRIKAAYIDQLRSNDIVSSSLLPSIFSLIGLSDRNRPFDMSPWAIDEYRLDLIDELDSTNLAVLASFVYYRSLQALPSLVRLWWEACRNRQLSMAVSSMTSRHFSPVLIASELAHLRDPDDPAGKALRDNEDFTVKVAGGANEVKAVFVIDEQNMEILIKLPNEFPLVGVEVKDIRKVGVSDAQWRAWLLAVQQVVSAQNSSIADGLSLFKRNVSGHFEGIEACAICYSIIHVIDRSKPMKDCNTCHNKFHAACLYKWFTSSHSASCPMCRSSEGFR